MTPSRKHQDKQSRFSVHPWALEIPEIQLLMEAFPLQKICHCLDLKTVVADTFGLSEYNRNIAVFEVINTSLALISEGMNQFPR